VGGINRAKTAPCQAACPAGVDVPRYIRHIQHGRFGQALAVVRERIPFPLVCGYACFHPCEAKCGRNQFDAPVAIRMLKRVAAERGGDEQVAPAPRAASGKKAAIIGSGPCGLTSAYYLALQGHDVTVFEALGRSGGMLRFGIPAYRLPDEVVDEDVRLIEQAGVKIRTGTRVASAEALLGQGFDAVLIASGAWRSAKMGIPGEDAAQVLDGLSFLKDVNAGAALKLGARVVVVGGGNTAIDAARVSRRLGAEVVQLYRRTQAEMPASAEEIADALAEGVQIEYLRAPVRIDPGEVTCIRMALGPADASGRPRPVAVAGSEYAIFADTVIVAIGQEAEVPAASVAREGKGTVVVHGETLATSTPGIFAGGDAVAGPASIIDAIGQGRRAAIAIDRFLGGSGAIDRDAGDAMRPEPAQEMPRGTPRNPFRTIPLTQRLAGFDLVEQAYDTRTATREAARCVSCDLREFGVEVNPVVCKDCGYCQEVCALDVFARSDQFNAGGYQPAVAARAENCIGCLRCLYICPDFAITITDRQVQ
jgi:NADPH-dependent glutamate synthase beta subunit-like oxidoreductase/NAD-dependent dihydropyrimidine dehydrogenase PreA subunit